MSNTIFDKIISGEIKSWKVWEDKKYLAFLTPFPNTPGMTLVIPKTNEGDYVFSVSEEAYVGLMQAAKRVALVFEGTGVAYVHAKLYPLHGKLAGETNVWSKHTEFYPEYLGYLTTVEGPKMLEADLDENQRKILEAQKA